MVIALLVGLGLGCPGVNPYACTNDEQCVLEGAQGICDPEADRCAYPSGDCPTGYRFPEVTDGDLGGRCTVMSTPATPAATDVTAGGVDDSASGVASGVASDGADDTSGSTGGTEECVLVDSDPLIITEDPGGPIERLRIESSGAPAIWIQGVPNVHIRDVEIHFAGGPGIRVDGGSGVHIERVLLVNTGLGGSGHAGVADYGIRVFDSPDTTINDVRVLDPWTGIQVTNSDRLEVRDFVIENARGLDETDEGGQGLLVQQSQDVLVESFACFNDPNLGTAHAGIFIDRCTDAVVREGVVTDVNHRRGAGVRVHTNGGGQNVTVQGVDVVRGCHSCFNIVGGNEVDLVDTGCRNMMGCFEVTDDGLVKRNNHGWVTHMPVGMLTRVTQGRHYNVFSLKSGLGFESFEVMPDQFTPRLPPVVVEPCGG